MSLLGKIRTIFNRGQKIRLIILFLLMFIGAILELLGVSLILPFVQGIMDPETLLGNQILAPIYRFLNLNTGKELILFMAIALIALYFFKNCYLLGMYYIQYRFVYNNQAEFSIRLMDCYIKKPYTFHLQKNTAEIVCSVTRDVERLFQLVLHALSLLAEVLIAFLLGVYLMIMDVTITLTVIALLGSSILIFYKIFSQKLRTAGVKNQQYSAEMIQWINQSMGGLKEVKVMRRENFFVEAFTKSGRLFASCQKKYNFLNQTPRFIIETVCICGVLGVIAIKIGAGADLEAIVPQLAVFAMAAFRLLPSVNRMNNYLNGILFYKSSVDSIYEDMKETEQKPEECTEFDEGMKVSEEFMNGGKGKNIQISHVSYHYPGQEKEVLSDVSLEIEQNTSIAFTGASGAGKTTLADIILGILPTNQGKILYGGADIKKFPYSWSQKLGYIPQDIYLSDDTIANNVAFGIKKEEVDEKKIWSALRQAQLDEFVRELDDLLDTRIGESGVRLSGGQRQRIGIARALYHDPEILVLDEATSALDNDTEKAVMDAIERLSGEKTMIIIAHRLSTIQHCNKVYKVEDGKLILSKK